VPVYHITFHAYRNWRPDHPRGYVKRKKILPPDPEQARAYDRNAKGDPVLFDEPIQRVLIRGAIEICERRKWRLHAVGTEAGHVHYLISWRGYIPCLNVMQKLKNLLSYILGKEIGPRGKRWFVRNGSRKRVKEQKHLDYLVETYLPDHRGVFWREGQPIP
jgi:REP element-mobilizing transposase RayT